MKNPNGYGTIRKLSGKRRKPFGVYITVGNTVAPNVPKIDFLSEFLPKEVYSDVERYYNEYLATLPPKARQVQKSIGYFATRQEAMIALAEYNKKPFDIDKQNITFGEVYKAIYERDISRKKDSCRKQYIAAFNKCGPLLNLKMREIRLTHLQNLVDSYGVNSKSVQNQLIVLLHAVFKYSMENDIVEKDYSQFLKTTSHVRKSDRRPYSKDEIKILWDNIDWSYSTIRKTKLTNVKPVDFLLVMIYSGMRIGELLSMKNEDVHLKERWIDLKGTKTKAAERVVPIHKNLIPIFEEKLKTGNEYVFGDKNGNPIIYENITRMLGLMPTKFVTDHTLHECRHTFISIATACGLNQVLLKKIVGHASADITQGTYTHAYIDDLIKEIDKFKI